MPKGRKKGHIYLDLLHRRLVNTLNRLHEEVRQIKTFNGQGDDVIPKKILGKFETAEKNVAEAVKTIKSKFGA